MWRLLDNIGYIWYWQARTDGCGWSQDTTADIVGVNRVHYKTLQSIT